MSIANKLVYANRDYRANFVEELEAGRAQYEPLLNATMTTFPSNGPGIEHSFSDALKGMEEWVDERVMAKLGADSFYVANKSYAAGVEVDRDDLEDDQIGLYRPRIRGLAEKYWLHRFDQLGDLLNNGATTTCWDGKYYFDDDHPLADSASVNDNLSSSALAEAAVQAAITQLRDMKDTQGNKLHLNPTHLIFGNDLEWTATDILKQERQSTGESNVLRGMLQPLQISNMTAASWAVADLSKTLKPFMYQDRRAPDLIEQTSTQTDDYFNRKLFKWGVDYRGRSYYGFYQTIVWSAGS